MMMNNTLEQLRDLKLAGMAAGRRRTTHRQRRTRR